MKQGTPREVIVNQSMELQARVQAEADERDAYFHREARLVVAALMMRPATHDEAVERLVKLQWNARHMEIADIRRDRERELRMGSELFGK